MRITVGIDDRVIAKLVALSEAKNKSQAVNIAVIEFLRRRGKARLLRLRGKLRLENNWKKLREGELDEK